LSKNLVNWKNCRTFAPEMKKTKDMSITAEFVKNMKSGEYLSDKRVLSAMKRRGLIKGYSDLGDIERVGIEYGNGGVAYYEIFPNGNVDKVGKHKCATRAEVTEVFGGNRTIVYEGVKFTTASKSGCVNPFLVKLF